MRFLSVSTKSASELRRHIFMIRPIVAEQDWLSLLANTSVWPLRPARTVVVAPHPDDESLATGGLIAQLIADGNEVHVVAVTDGEAAYSRDDARELSPRRRQEQGSALVELGVPAAHVHRLHLEDSGIAKDEDRLTELLFELLDDGSHIVAPWRRDVHPDHEACGRAAYVAAQRAGADFTEWLFWAWHRHKRNVLEHLPLVRLPLNDEAWARKQRAIACHESQLCADYGEPILDDALLKPARRPFEVYLPTC